MKIDTNYFGEIEIDEQEILEFKQGLPGFLDEKQFILLNFDEAAAFQVLQSIKTKALAFIVVTPFDFVSDYQVTLDDVTLEQLEITTEEEVLILNLVTLKGTLKESTSNLQAPVVINTSNRYAKQIILHTTVYPTKASIFENEDARGAK